MLHCATPCPGCPNQDGRGVVPNDGPDTSYILFIGEGPGFWENEKSVPFVGRTGKEFNNNYLPKFAKISRRDVKIVNSVSCYFDGKNQTRDQARQCAPVNVEPLVRSMPNLRLIVFMGGVSASMLEWAAVDAATGGPVSVPNLMVEHGLPVNDGKEILFFGRRVRAIAVLHPAAGLHQASAMTDIIEDFENVYRWRIGEWNGVVDPFAGREEYLEVRNEDADLLLSSCRGAGVLGIDTELTSKRFPWCIQGSVAPGTGFMIRADQKLALEAFQELLLSVDEILIHNAKFDLVIADRMRLHVPLPKVIDTMLWAYTKGLPQALKTLARRLCGMKMMDWEEIVWPQYESDAMFWLYEAYGIVESLVESAEEQTYKVLRGMAEDQIPADAKNREAAVNKLVKEFMQGLIDEQQDWWRPPLETNPETGRKHRGVGYHKLIDRIMKDHLRSTSEGHKGIDFQQRWFGDGDDDEDEQDLRMLDDGDGEEEAERKLGVFDRLPAWALKPIREKCGEFPRMGLDQAPYEQALFYSCRDPDATLRVWEKIR